MLSSTLCLRFGRDRDWFLRHITILLRLHSRELNMLRQVILFEHMVASTLPIDLESVDGFLKGVQEAKLAVTILVET